MRLRLALALGMVLGSGCAADPSLVEKTFAEHEGELAQSRSIRPQLRLECSEPDAEVLLDGVMQGQCADFSAAGLALDDGPHRVEVRKTGFLPFFTEVQAGRARASLRVELSRLN